MATSNPLARFLTGTPQSDPLDDIQPGDTSRMAVQAFIFKNSGSTPATTSVGALRLHGAGVSGSMAALADVGQIANAWQRLISAVGAALEGSQTLRGQLPSGIIERTTLMLTASPTPGSVVLDLMPKPSFRPGSLVGEQITMFGEERSLADRAADTLIDLLATAAPGEEHEVGGLTETMKRLGPRVGSSLMSFADSLLRSDITMTAMWREPQRSTRRAEVTPTAARWIRGFVSGRELDAEDDQMVGVLRTISDTEPWLIELEGQAVRMNASKLAAAAIGQFHVGQNVMLTVRTTIREQPDGRTYAAHKILEVEPSD